jgi:copper chaperone CopZ
MSETKGSATATFAVHGMHCEGCVNAIQTALGECDGVIEGKVDLAESTAVVTYDPAKLSPADLLTTIEELGYTTEEKK